MDFRDEEHTTNKVLHTLENLNFASPLKDWDEGDYSVQQFRERASSVRKEMIWTQTINFLTTILMLVPLWYTGIDVQKPPGACTAPQTLKFIINPLFKFP